MFLEAEPVLLAPDSSCDQLLIDYSQSLHNWYEQINLGCATPLQVSVLNSAFLVAQAVSFLIIPYLAKRYGPRRVWLLLQY